MKTHKIKFVMFVLGFFSLISTTGATLSVTATGAEDIGGTSTGSLFFDSTVSGENAYITTPNDTYIYIKTNKPYIDTTNSTVSEYYNEEGILSSNIYGEFYIKKDNDLKFTKEEDLNNAFCGGKTYYKFESGEFYSPLFAETTINESSYFCGGLNKFQLSLTNSLIGNFNISTTTGTVNSSTTIETADGDKINVSDITSNKDIDVGGKISNTAGVSDVEKDASSTKFVVETNLKLDKTDFKRTIDSNIVKFAKVLPKKTSTSINSLSDGSLFQKVGNNEHIALFNFEGTTAASASNNQNQGKIVTLGSGGSVGSYSKLSVTGKKTIIVKGGNLYINGDIYNTDDNSSLLTIIVKRDSTNLKNGGNVYINPNVTNIDAIIVAEGSIMNYNSSGVVTQSNSSNTLRRQLLIYGTVSSKNNIGYDEDGALKVPYGSDAYYTGGKTTSDSGIYNLSYLREFRVNTSNYLKEESTDILYSGDEDDLSGINYSGEYILEYSFAGKRYKSTADSAKAGLRTTTKLAPVVIEYNPKVISNTPLILQK